MSVQVAVRVRPFNKREVELGTPLCVEMQGTRTLLKDINDPDKNKEFFFDFSFWSHDGFRTLPDGTMVPEDENSIYADQKRVFDLLGRRVLENAWAGYHCCMFAYGQTGSGKSYSVMGYKPNVGIVPIACREIFNQIREQSHDPTKQFEVNFGMMEIYNEKVQDLLIAVEKRPPQGMKIRESQTLGFYPEGLRKVPVRSFEEIEQRMDEGTSHRSVAATQMNATSSRAHTIIMIEFKQTLSNNGRKVEKFSVMNLVDLAGSEKVGKTGATGDRLKEAANINKSLSMLGMVISTLADIESGKTGKKVPYRDSALTKLLANALGGNSKTIMICAISPAYDNFEESLSTLRYADQAKKIKNKAIVNESATDKLIRELKSENDRLKEMLTNFEKIFSGNFDPKDPEILKKLEQFKDLQEHIQANQKLMEEQEMTAEERLQEMEEQNSTKRETVDRSQPHMTNLNEDPQLNSKIAYPLQGAVTSIGRKHGNPVPEIILNGLGIRANHCFIANEDGALYLQPEAADENIRDFLFVNGVKCGERTRLKHNDRVIIGTQIAFVVKIPGSENDQSEGTPPEHEITWEYAQQELTKILDKLMQEKAEALKKQMNMSMEERLKEVELRHQREIEELEKERRELIEGYDKKVVELQDELQQNRKNGVGLDMNKTQIMKAKWLNVMNKLKRKQTQSEDKNAEEKLRLIAQEAIRRKEHESKQKQLEDELAQIMPKLNEMNLIADELGRDVKFALKMSDNPDESVKVVVQNKENGTHYSWDVEKALNRYYCLRDQLEEFNMTGERKQGGNNEEDPFWDPPDPNVLGRALLKLAPLAYNLDNPDELWVLEEQTEKIKGLLRVNIFPTDQRGRKNLASESENHAPNPQTLVGNKMYVKVVIQSAKLSPNVQDTYVEYNFMNKSYRTRTVSGHEKRPVYKYEAVHPFTVLSTSDVDYFLRTTLQFKVYGVIDHQGDGVFLGQKSKNVSIEEADPQAQKERNQRLEKEKHDKKREEEKRKKRLEKQKRQEDKAFQDEDTLPLYKQKWLHATVYGAISFILFVVVLITSKSYRSAFVALGNLEEQSIVADYEVNYRSWRLFSITQNIAGVMMALIGMSVIAAKCLPHQIKELAYISTLPFLLWWFATILFILLKKGFEQFSYASDFGAGGTCTGEEAASPVCGFKSSLRKFDATAAACLALLSVFFALYIWTLLQWAKKREQFQEAFAKEKQKAGTVEVNGANDNLIGGQTPHAAPGQLEIVGSEEHNNNEEAVSAIVRSPINRNREYRNLSEGTPNAQLLRYNEPLRNDVD